MIRPQPAQWFEILAAKDDVGLLLGALARSGCVELEAHAGAESAPGTLPQTLQRFDALAERFAAYWPQPAPRIPPLEIEDMAARGMSAIEAWSRAAAPLIEALHSLEAEGAGLRLWRELLAQIGTGGIDLGALAAPGAQIEGALFRFPAGGAAPLPDTVVGLTVTVAGEAALLAFGPAQALAILAQQAAGASGERLAIPAWLRGDAAGGLAFAAARLEAVEKSLAAKRAELDQISALARLGEALGQLRHAQWMARSLPLMERGDNFCRISGWTDERARLLAALDASGARALARFPPPPEGAEAPLLLRNPWWARPYEVFSRALGMPARYAADPSVLLAFIAPLLFGYMFGDIGQGALLVAAGLALRKRVPVLGMLVGGGISAMLFGALFGSVFGLHNVVPALWVAPLEAPLPVLVVPLFGGASLLALGLAINALEARWRGKLAEWLAADAGLIAVYAGVLLGFLARGWLWLAAFGAAATLVGQLVLTRRPGAALGALGNLLEKTVQLLVNTISFVRVGAFALAHAGLSAAVLALADAADSAVTRGVVLIAGNVVVIVVEAMVVAIQTTRLVLFEFFTRFFISKGREFQPLPPPVSFPGGLRESTS